MITIGVDCGVSGAWAALDANCNNIALADLPIMVSGKTKWIDGDRLLGQILNLARDYSTSNGRPTIRAVVEQTHPGQLGTIAANSKGLTLGSTLAALQIAGCSIELVQAHVWKKAMGLLMPKATDREKKHAGLSKARLLFPLAPLDREKDHNRGEALCIAWWATRQQARAA